MTCLSIEVSIQKQENLPFEILFDHRGRREGLEVVTESESETTVCFLDLEIAVSKSFDFRPQSTHVDRPKPPGGQNIRFLDLNSSLDFETARLPVNVLQSNARHHQKQSPRPAC